MKQNLFLTYLLLLCCNFAVSQEKTPVLLGVTGFISSSYGSSYSISYSIGELAVETVASENNSLTQGFQQPYDTIIIEKCNDCPELIKAFPNPFKEKLYITYYKQGISKFSIEVYNIKGSKILQKNFDNVFYGERIDLNLEDLPKGLYLFHVYSDDKKLYDKFKIIKI